MAAVNRLQGVARSIMEMAPSKDTVKSMALKAGAVAGALVTGALMLNELSDNCRCGFMERQTNWIEESTGVTSTVLTVLSALATAKCAQLAGRNVVPVKKHM